MPVVISGTNGVSGVDGTASNPSYEGTDSNTGIFFPAADTIAFSEGGVESMRIDSSGNVGIGTTSPANKLDVVASGDVAKFGNTKKLFVSTDSGGFGLFSAASQANTGIYASDTSNFVYFATSSAERVRIDSSGNLLVGTTSTDSGAKMRVNYSTSQNGIQIRDAANTSGTSFLIFQDGNNSNIGTVSRVGTTNAVVYNTTSDYRLKTVVGSVTGARERINALNPIDYYWTEGGQQARGFLAHEFKEVYANSVTGEKDAVDGEGNPVYQAMQASTPEVIADLVALIQEQQQMIETLQAKVAALEAK
jgi:hypothetical protein